jgi:hypothetical protein
MGATRTVRPRRARHHRSHPHGLTPASLALEVTPPCPAGKARTKVAQVLQRPPPRRLASRYLAASAHHTRDGGVLSSGRGNHGLWFRFAPTTILLHRPG